MKYENAYRSVVEFLGSDAGSGFDLTDAQVEELAKRLVMRVKPDLVMEPAAVESHAAALFPKPDPDYVRRTTPPSQQKQTREEILKVCAKFFNVDANHPEKKTFWECVCPLNPPPITKEATVGSEINRRIFFAEVDKFVAAGKPIRIDVLTDIAAYLSRANQLERYPAPVEVVPPPTPPSERDLHNEQVARDRAMNQRDMSPIKGAKEKATPLITEHKAVLTEEQRVALNAKKREDDATIAEALSRINGYSSYSHSRTYSGRAQLREVFQASMDSGKSAEDVLAAVVAKIDVLTDNGSVR